MEKTVEELTPEEKLLSVIEGKSRIRPQDFAKRGNFSVLTEAINFKKIFADIFLQEGVDSAYKFLITLCIIFTIAGIATFYMYKTKFDKKTTQLIANFRPVFATAVDDPPALPQLNTYLDNTTANNPFGELPLSQKEIEPKTEPIADKFNLELAGIIWTEPPQAIIAEKTSGKTVLLSIGEKIDNDWTLDKIERNSVTVSNGEKKYILR